VRDILEEFYSNIESGLPMLGFRRKRNLILFMLGLTLIILGCVLKYSSPPFLGDITSLIGLVLSILAVITDQTDKLLENQERTLQLLSKISSILKRIEEILRKA
jgi:uncharacterized membrane protein